jgi:hypothetical protein
VTFKNDDSTVDTQEIEYNKTVDFTKVSKPEKASSSTENYRFIGWSTSTNAEDIVDTYTVTQDTELYAIYSASTRYYTVTFKYYVNGVETTSTVENIEYNGTVSSLPETDDVLTITYSNGGKTYRRFSGWTDDFDTNTNVTSSIEISALYNNVSSDSTHVYRLKTEMVGKGLSKSDIENARKTGKGFNSSFYENLTSKVSTISFIDYNGEIAKTISEAATSSNSEAIIALGDENVRKFLTSESLETLNNLNTSSCTYEWYVLKYNSGDGWHLDGLCK